MLFTQVAFEENNFPEETEIIFLPLKKMETSIESSKMIHVRWDKIVIFWNINVS